MANASTKSRRRKFIRINLFMIGFLLIFGLKTSFASVLFFSSVKKVTFVKFAGCSKIRDFHEIWGDKSYEQVFSVADLLDGAMWLDLSSLGYSLNRLPRIKNDLIFDMGSDSGPEGYEGSVVLNRSGEVLYAAVIIPSCVTNKTSIGWTCTYNDMDIFVKNKSDDIDALRIFENWRKNLISYMVLPSELRTTEAYDMIFENSAEWLRYPVETTKTTRFFLLPISGCDVIGSD